MLASANFALKRPMKKLADKYLDPFEIVQAVGKNAYRLSLSVGWKIHSVFNVALLEPYVRRSGVISPAPDILDGEEEWEIETILDSRTHYGKLQYLVRWKGYPGQDQWEPATHLDHAKDSIEAFLESRKGKPTKQKRRCTKK